MSARLLLLRHGRTAWNADRRFQGQEDPPLDPTGEAQAAAVAQVLAPLRPDVLVTSDLQRAAQTAAPLAAATGLVARQDPRLREIALGAWQGLSGPEAEAAFPEEYAAWRRGEDVRRGGGETYAEVAARAVMAVREALAAAPDGGLVVAVTHGGTARAAAGAMLGLPHPSWSVLGPLGNCRFLALVPAPGSGPGERWRLAEHNSTQPEARLGNPAPVGGVGGGTGAARQAQPVR